MCIYLYIYMYTHIHTCSFYIRFREIVGKSPYTPWKSAILNISNKTFQFFCFALTFSQPCLHTHKYTHKYYFKDLITFKMFLGTNNLFSKGQHYWIQVNWISPKSIFFWLSTLDHSLKYLKVTKGELPMIFYAKVRLHQNTTNFLSLWQQVIYNHNSLNVGNSNTAWDGSTF